MYLTRARQGPREPKKEVPGRNQSGYLFGTGERLTQIGESDSWHWRAEEGLSIARWELYYGDRNIGMEVYPTHEGKDWPDILFQMLLGLKGLAEIPMDDDEVDDIIFHAKQCAVGTTGFPWLSKKSKNPYPKGTPQYELWSYTYRCEYAKEHGTEFRA